MERKLAASDTMRHCRLVAPCRCSGRTLEQRNKSQCRNRRSEIGPDPSTIPAPRSIYWRPHEVKSEGGNYEVRVEPRDIVSTPSLTLKHLFHSRS